MSVSSSGLPGHGLYFIDVLACLLFCIVLALVAARFDHERSVEVELPKLEPRPETGADLAGPTIAVRSEGDAAALYLDGEALSLSELEERLRAAPPPAVLVRAERSPLSDVIAAAHAAGVHAIRIAYEARARQEGP